MADIVFFAVGLMWILVSQQVKYWMVITALGFPSCTPAGFIQKDYLYVFVSWILFLGTIVLAFFQSVLTPWILIPIILIIAHITKRHALSRGCAKYRQILHELRKVRVADGEGTSDIDECLVKTNSELIDEARQLMALQGGWHR